MKPGDRGDDVREMQLAIKKAADPLPRHGADGHFGAETAAALAAFCSARGISYGGGVVPEKAMRELGLAAPGDIDGVRIYDLRSEARDPHPKSSTSGGRTRIREPAAITGIVLHQTAIEYGLPSDDTTELGLARRSLSTACHAMAFDGFATLAAPLAWHIWHADGLNSHTLGLEVEGNFPGLIGGRIRNHHPATKLTDRRIASARAALRALVEAAKAEGCEIRHIYAHRQADSWRRADPGEGLWRAVVLDYAVPVLGLQTDPGRAWPDPQGVAGRNGRPVPVDWDPGGVGRY